MPRTTTRAEQIAENQLSLDASDIVGVSEHDIVRFNGTAYVPAPRANEVVTLTYIKDVSHS